MLHGIMSTLLIKVLYGFIYEIMLKQIIFFVKISFVVQSMLYNVEASLDKVFRLNMITWSPKIES
jgi:hypothetical protein